MSHSMAHIRAIEPSGTALPMLTERLSLPFERRVKARQRVLLESGREAGIQLPRGTVLRGGDLLRASDGSTVLVVAAPEAVSTVHVPSPRELARVAYHLGNRHVELEVGDGWVRYLKDHVLDAMVEGLGWPVLHEHAPFEPEAGAYQSGHRHGHSHSHDHLHPHAHSHSHDHAHDHEHGHRQSHPHRHTHD
jgi:urease accessory protein